MRIPTSYERAALREIAAFRAELFPPLERGERIERARARAEVPEASAARRAGRALLEVVASPLERALTEASSPVAAARVVEAFQEAGYRGIQKPPDAQHLSLHEVDGVASGLMRRHAIAAAMSGATAGALGVGGALAEAPVIATLALRAIVECAWHYGYEPTSASERAFTLDVLAVATGPTLSSRQHALEHATGLIWMSDGSSVAGPPSSGAVATRVLARRVAQATLVGVAQKRLGRAAPIVTSALGAALNARFLYRVVRVARLLYRERFLVRRCGPAMVALCEAGVDMSEAGAALFISTGHTPLAHS